MINSLVSFMQRDYLPISEINHAFLKKYSDYLNQRRNERIARMRTTGKRIPSNRMMSLYLGSIGIYTRKRRMLITTMIAALS